MIFCLLRNHIKPHNSYSFTKSSDFLQLFWKRDDRNSNITKQKLGLMLFYTVTVTDIKIHFQGNTEIYSHNEVLTVVKCF